jgi:hypothetical protein
VIIVDDKLSLDALSGRFGATDTVATTWGFHFRLLRALSDDGRLGSLGKRAAGQARAAVAHPPDSRLRVLDPRTITDEAAELAARHRLNVLAAELVAAATHYRAAVQLSEPNVGRRWPEVMAAEGVALTVV